MTFRGNDLSRIEDMVTRFLTLTIAFLFILGNVPPVVGAVFTSARTLATSGGLSADARDVDAVFVNPANLAFWGDRAVRVRLLSASASVSNNSLSLSDYNGYTGSTLSEKDKANILDKIPRYGLSVDGEAVVTALAVAYKEYALVFSGLGAGHGDFSKDYFDLLLYGNELDRTYSIEDTEGEAYLTSVLSLSGSRIIRRGAADTLSVGLTLKWLRGFLYGGSSEMEGGVAFHSDGFTAAGTASGLKSEGGSGFAFDFGASYRVGSWIHSVSFLNIGDIKWDQEVEKKIFTFQADSVMIYDDRDTLFDIGSDTTIYGGSFKSKLPSKMVLATTWKTAPRWTLGVAWEQGFRDGPAVSKSPYLALGGEYYPTWWLTLRSGLGLGGSRGVFGSLGFGLVFSDFSLDFALANRGIFKAKGVAFALTMDLLM
jgi:hypothetical protein